ncbi:MAG TPA: protease modulator HflC, partial [Thiolinea sp.]|nr:protease modulator HflC [Thiolinea sp.]
MDRKNLIIGAVIAVFLLVWSMAYTVSERELAIKFKFREIVQDNQEPGLHFKLPFIETISKFPKPIQNLNA